MFTQFDLLVTLQQLQCFTATMLPFSDPNVRFSTLQDCAHFFQQFLIFVMMLRPCCCVVEQDTDRKLAAVVQFAVSMSPQDMRAQVRSPDWAERCIFVSRAFPHTLCVILC